MIAYIQYDEYQAAVKGQNYSLIAYVYIGEMSSSCNNNISTLLCTHDEYQAYVTMKEVLDCIHVMNIKQL